MTPLELNLDNLAQRLRLFDRAVDAAKARDDTAFHEAMDAFWNPRDGGCANNAPPVNK